MATANAQNASIKAKPQLINWKIPWRLRPLSGGHISSPRVYYWCIVLSDDLDSHLAQEGEDQEADGEDAGPDSHFVEGRHILVELTQRVWSHTRDYQGHALFDVHTGEDEHATEVERE